MFGQQVGVGGTKQICSYYLKGTCKYGAKCWNYHPPNQGGGGGGSSGGGVFGGSASVFGGKSGGQQDSKEFSDFVKQVSGEMTQWERSGQWLVSSFSPLKAHPPLVGFSDTSPEEFRIEAYTANKTNTCAAYQAKWMEVQQTFKQLREALKMSTAEAVQALRDVFYSKSPLEQQQVLKQPAGLFGKTSGGSMFGGSSGTANTGPGLLGAAPQAAQGSLFGAATPSIFGGGAAQTPATPGIFGGSAAQTATAKSLFGTQTSVLGTSGGSVFGAQPAAAAAAAPSVFGATPAVPQAATPGSLFGAAPSPASAQTPGSVFGAASTAQATPGTVPQTSIFGQPQQQRQGGLFGSQPQQAQQGGLFGSQAPQQQQQQPQQTSLFGAQPQQQTSLFGGQPQQQTSLFGGQPQQQTQQTGGLFGAQPQQQQQQQQQTQSAGLFGAQPQQQQQAGSVFGAQPQQQQQQTPSAGLFGAQPQPQQQQQQAGSVFGTQPQQQQQQSAGLFGAQPQQAGGLFGAQPLQQQQQQQQQPGSVFGGQPQASTATATPSIFSGGGAATQPQSGATGSIFGGTTFGGIKPGLFGGGGEAAPKPGLFGKPAEPVPGLFGQGQPAATAAPSQAGHNYTPLDQLTPQDRAQFEADAFTFVPLCPPPLELCA